jgi:predicted tellurium resistance membrane protein TerC
MLMRILLLLSLSWLMRLTEPLVTVTQFGLDHAVSGRDLILLLGGLFLIGKATYEIHDKVEGEGEHGLTQRRTPSFSVAIVQVVLLDIIFSLDSVITAVGMAREIVIMVAAVVIAVGLMFFFAGPIARFVERHPTIKMLALSFLVLVGVMLVVEGLHQHVPKGYIYFAMAFSLGVEFLNIRASKNRKGQAAAPTSSGDPG